jgi:hypothetical protein
LPAKSKHGKGKRHRGKKKHKFRQAQPVTGITQETSGNVPRDSAPAAAAPAVKVPVQKKASASAALPLHYEFISGDLKRIGILTVVIVVLLIVAYYIIA